MLDILSVVGDRPNYLSDIQWRAARACTATEIHGSPPCLRDSSHDPATGRLTLVLTKIILARFSPPPLQSESFHTASRSVGRHHDH